jgi:diguanylate cyclase (GGDEF)-like protein
MSSDEFFEELRREYLTEAPARLQELKKDLSAARAGEQGAAASLRMRLHRLAGSGGSYGFPGISQTSRSAEQWLNTNHTLDDHGLEQLELAVDAVARAFDQAAIEFGLPATPSRRTGFGWQALIIGYAGGVADQIEATLSAAQYSVRREPPSLDPAGIPVSERADLAVIAPLEPDRSDGVIERWARPGPARPGKVVLVADPTTIDPLSLPGGYLDLVVAPARIDDDLLRFAQTLGSYRTAPRTALVVSPDPGLTVSLSGALDLAGVRVVAVAGGAEARKALAEVAPDVIVAARDLPDTTGGALIHWIRTLPAHRLTPIAIVTEGLTEADRLSAEEAAADLVLSRGMSRADLSNVLLARIERGLEARSLTYRDHLTGLLSQAAMVEEVEHAVAQARRRGESLVYLALDLDHFRRLNEQHGQAIGDAILIHLARVVSSSLRAGDFAARTGGEEIGILVLRCSVDHARKLAEKLRAAVSREPVSAGSASIPIRVSVGVASYPEHAASAQDLIRAADRALARAKSSGRDRVVVGME